MQRAGIMAAIVACLCAFAYAQETRPSADAIAAERQAWVKAVDGRIASLAAMYDQIPPEQQGQSQTGKRLADALAEKARAESASDGEITARIEANRGGASRDMTTQATTRGNDAEGDSVTTRPVLSGFEIQAVFPGAQSHGQSEAVVRPPAGCELVTLHGADGVKIIALYGKSTIAKPPAMKPALMFFYGNGACMAYSLDEFNRFRGLGFNVIMADYEGYGMSDGSPSEAGCYAAADATYDYLFMRPDIDKGKIVATGWSLGAAVAIDLASRRPVAGLATFSAFTNIGDMARALMGGLPVIVPLSSRFDNMAKIGSVGCPILLVHGTRDSLVPSEMLARLEKAAGSNATHMYIDGADHNDIFQRGGDALYERLKGFVDGLAAVSPTTRPG